MVIIAPYDGSVLARSALRHAVNSSKLYEVDVIAVTVVPRNRADYARENGWLTADETYDIDTITTRLREQIAEVSSQVDFECITVGSYASSGTVSSEIRRFAREKEATAVFIGSDEAGHLSIGANSVGGRIAAGKNYDVAIIRNPLPDMASQKANRSGISDPQ